MERLLATRGCIVYISPMGVNDETLFRALGMATAFAAPISDDLIADAERYTKIISSFANGPCSEIHVAHPLGARGPRHLSLVVDS